MIINVIVIWKAGPSFPAYKSDLECGLKIKNNFKKNPDKKADQIFMLPAVILCVFPRIVHPDLCSILIQMA